MNDVSVRTIARFLAAAVLTTCAVPNAAISMPSIAAAMTHPGSA
jgi:cutinase